MRPPADHDARMAWWREARFGMFLHWGLYAIPAGKWGNQTNYGEWVRDSARIPRDVYDGFRPTWTPTRFDADAWAQMPADAGMKYVVITSKHHDGFCLWDSEQTTWDVGSTPHATDILQQLAEACHRRGIVFCTYHSIMDWHHPDYLPRRPGEKGRTRAGAHVAGGDRYPPGLVAEKMTSFSRKSVCFMMTRTPLARVISVTPNSGTVRSATITAGAGGSAIRAAVLDTWST